MLVVGTWNLENFFPPGKGSASTSEAAYDEKLAQLASVINAIGPDVLAVQEVGAPKALKDLVDKLGGAWQTAISQFPDGRGIRVGFLSRLEMTDHTEVRVFAGALQAIQAADNGSVSTMMGRGALRVRVSHDGHDVDLVTCHLKSKLLEFPSGPDGKPRFDTDDEDERARVAAYALYRRAAEAATVRCYVDRLLDGHGKERPVIVLGDLNDEPSAATTQILQGPPGSEFGTGGFGKPDRGDQWRLWNLAPLIQPPSEQYSRTFEGHKELIDHILVSHALADEHTKVTVHRQGAQSIGVNPADRVNKPASDHDPVVAQLDRA